MGAFGVIFGTLHYMGLYIQLSASTRQGGHAEVENHITGNAVFTEIPHDMTAQSGHEVEMACSFRGAGTPSYSLEIQWWYIRNHRDWTEKQPWATNQVVDEMSKEATKISVVKVAGSNISHKLRLSSVKPSDEGTYECRVIDFSDVTTPRHHRVRAYLRVVPATGRHGDDDAQELRHHGNNFQPSHSHRSEHADAGHAPGAPRRSAHHTAEPGAAQRSAHHTAEPGKELRKRSAEENSDAPADCPDSCVL